MGGAACLLWFFLLWHFGMSAETKKVIKKTSKTPGIRQEKRNFFAKKK